MVSKLGKKGLIPPTERQIKSNKLRTRKLARNPEAECLWTMGTERYITNNEILEDL